MADLKVPQESSYQQDYVAITQIALDSEGVKLYGVGEDGVVYEYNWGGYWEALQMMVKK